MSVELIIVVAAVAALGYAYVSHKAAVDAEAKKLGSELKSAEEKAKSMMGMVVMPDVPAAPDAPVAPVVPATPDAPAAPVADAPVSAPKDPSKPAA